MDRNRDARRMTMAAANGLPRRRQRSSGLRDSPEEDGTMELQETARLRDRKKDRDRDRDRDRERERDRERDRLNRSKRRRNGGGGAERDESSEESVNDEEDDEDEEAAGGASLRMLPPLNPSPASGAMSMAAISASSSLMNTHHNHNHHHHHHQHHIHSNQNNNSNNNIISHSSNNNNNSNNNYSHHQLQHQRKSFPPPSKNFRQPPPAVAVATLKGADEMIGVSVPRKARSVSTKRSHEWSSSAIGIVSDHSHRQASTSPVRQSLPTSVSSASPAPVSPPSSSNASVRRKLKPNGGPKLRQPKPPPPPSSSKSSSAAQDEIEIEIAEVLYGMMTQPQGPAKQETMVNNDISNHNKSSGDAKSRVSSPISGYQYGAPQPPNRPSQLPGGDSAVPAWAFCVAAPKRKKPRLVKYDGKYEDGKPSYLPFQNNSSSSSPKIPTDQLAKTDSSSATHEKNLGSAPENGGIASDTAQSHSPSSESQPEPVKLENSLVSDSKPVANKSEGRDLSTNKEDPQSPKKESSSLRLDDKRETATTSKLNSTTSEIESQREDKFQIDLMAPPPSRSSPERDGETDFVATDAKPMAKDTETELKPVIKEDTANALKLGRELQPEHEIAEPEKAKTAITCSTVEDSESKKLPAVNVKERNIDLQLDLEKTDNTGSRDGANANKLHHQQNHHSFPRHHQPQPQTQQNNHDKTAQSGALPMPTMSMATWPGGLPPMGYMTPLQGVVSMDGTGVSSAPAIQPPPYIFNQPRPKRCATHCYIARSISLHQQIARMSSFWPAAAGVPPGAGPASVYGGKPCNLNIMPSAADRGMNQDSKAHHNHVGKDKPSQAAPTGSVESAQRKQIVLQQALPHGAPPNLMQGPAIIFPLSQQQAVAAAAASVRPPGPAKTLPAAGNATGSNVVTGGSQAMTYNYPNMGGSEAAAAAPQYLAINAYSFPIPAHVGAPPAYRGGPHPQAMPFFNGSFYPTFHPSQLQQQPPTAQQHQGGHQNPSMSSGSSSSQKHLQNQTQSHQQRQSQSQSQHANATNGGVSLQGYPTSKNPSAQNQQIQIQMQQQQQQQRHMGRPLESEMGSEESPSTADSRGSRQSMSIYGHGQNFAMHAPPNFALMTPAPITNGEKKNQSQSQPQQPQQQQQSQQQGSKSGGVEPQAFAMSFTMNGAPAAPPGLDMASLTQQQAMFSDVRQGYQQYMAVAAAQAAAAAAQHKKTTDSGPAAEDERKGGTKGSSSQSIAFSRPDLCEASGSALPGSSVVDSSARTLSLGGSAQPRNSSNVNAQRNHHLQQQQLLQQQQQQQQQLHQQQQQQMIQQFQKHHQQQQQLVAAAASRNKPAAPMNGTTTTTTTTTTSTAYPDHHHNLAPSMAAKFPNAMSAFPGSPAHSPQWKSSGRSPAPPPQQVPSPSSAASSSLKNLPHSQQSRPQSHHTQISFAAAPPPPSQKPAAGSGNQSPSPPIMVGSPTTSSKAGAGGSNSPRTTPNPASSAGSNKPGQSSQQQQQQVKSHHHHHHNMKPSSPSVGGKNVNSPSILGNPHITSSSSSGKSQQQSQLSKQSLQQAQLFFSSYLPNQSQHNSNSAAVSAAAGSSPYYASASTQRRRPDQPLPPAQGTPSSSGMLSLSNTDASKANKGLPGQAMIHPAQFAAAVQSGNPHQILPAGFPYVHAVPDGVQVKPADQKQQAGE